MEFLKATGVHPEIKDMAIVVTKTTAHKAKIISKIQLT